MFLVNFVWENVFVASDTTYECCAVVTSSEDFEGKVIEVVYVDYYGHSRSLFCKAKINTQRVFIGIYCNRIFCYRLYAVPFTAIVYNK